MIKNNISIKVENISKRFRIGVKQLEHDNLVGALLSYIKSPLDNYRKYRSLYDFGDGGTSMNSESNDDTSVIWALKNLSFDVKRGEVVGIIGTNGAGKSTLLKILAKITPPTDGKISIRGRVSSLLEVGTGFHQELTGRENVYLNGTILGMKKSEVDKKFDEIIAFSGVEKFLDTPVKRYSSGMRVRLAFAVAAHLEPEILIIDEVLAVGDAAFQKKCIDKMEDVGHHGRTVLFVSHNMQAITRLCQRTILLNEGRVLKDGDTGEVVGTYLNAVSARTAKKEWADSSQAPGDDVARLRSVRVVTEDGQTQESVDIRKPIGLQMEYEVFHEEHILSPYYDLFNDEGIKIFTAIDLDPNWRRRPRPKGIYISTAWIPGNFLNEGTIRVGTNLLAMNSKHLHFAEEDVIAFQVVDTLDEDSARGDFTGKLRGSVRPKLTWTTRFEPDLGDHPVVV